MRIGGRENGRVYSQVGLLGMDLRDTVKGSRGRVVKNMMLKDGILSKRQGICDIAYITDENGAPLKINGIYKYEGKYVIHAGNQLVVADSLEPTLSFIDYKRTGCTLPDKQSQGFVCDGLLYLICDGAYIFDGESIAELYNSDISYVPVTRRGIKPQSEGGGYEDFESENIFTSKRKNILIGSKQGDSRYMLDELVDMSKEVNIKCTIDMSLYDNEYQTKMCGFKANKQINHTCVKGAFGIVSSELPGLFSNKGTTYGYDQVSEINIFFKNPIKASSLKLYSRNSNGIPRVEFKYLMETIYDTKEVKVTDVISLDSSKLGDVIDTINIYGNDAGAILDHMILYGKEGYQGEAILSYYKSAGSNSNVIPLERATTTSGEAISLFYNDRGTEAISGNIIMSHWEKRTLLSIPDKLSPVRKNEGGIEVTYHKKKAQKPKITLGSVCKIDTGREILAFCVNDSYVGFSSYDGDYTYVPRKNLLKLGADNESISAICQMWDFSIAIFKENQGYFARLRDDGPELFGFIDAYGCSSKNSIATVNKDTLFITQGGIFGSYGYTSQGQSLRSEAVCSLLKGKHKDAYLVGCDNKLYVFLDSCILVGDTGYKSYESSRLDSSFDYEWFIMDKEEITYATSIDNKLYLGTSDGKIRTQVKEFCDTEKRGILTGDALYSDGRLYLNSNLDPQDGDEIVVSSCYKEIAEILSCDGEVGRIYVSRDKLTANNEARLYKGMEIYLDTESRIKRTVNYIDYIDGYILTEPFDGEGIASKILLKCDTECLILRKEEDYFTINDYFGTVRLLDFDISRLSLIKKRDICCEYISAPIFLSEAAEAKNLYRIILSLNPECGNVSFGYETSRTLLEKSAELFEGVDFSNLSFNELTLGCDRYGTVLLRCYERFFDYIIFKVKSETNKDFAIRGFSMCYSSNGILKGDR